MGSPHDEMVKVILPQCAEGFKGEGVISDYNEQKYVEIPLIRDSKPIKICPDLLLYLPDQKKVVVEVANPRDPKRFVGELIYPHFLICFRKIDAGIVFVLPYSDRNDQSIYSRAMQQEIVALHLTGITSPSIIFLYLESINSEKICRIFRDSLKDYQRIGRFY